MLNHDIGDPPLKTEDWTDLWNSTAEYRTVFRLTWPTQLFWLVIYLAAFAFIAPRAFGHEFEEGTVVLCDTQEQIERFAALGSTPQAITIINAGKNVCAMVSVRYIRGREINRIRSGDKALQVVEVLIVQVNLHGHWGDIKPEVQYTLFPLEERSA
jgi:hypothetical protein